MSIKVRIPSQLRQLTGGTGEVVIAGDTVNQVLRQLDGTHPGLRERLFDQAGDLRRFVNVFIDEQDVRFLEGLETPVVTGQTLSIVPAVAGG